MVSRIKNIKKQRLFVTAYARIPRKKRKQHIQDGIKSMDGSSYVYLEKNYET
jgi:hypothetical protein